MAEQGKDKLIGEILLEQDAITPDQLTEALRLQKKRGGRVVHLLINLGHLSEEKLLECLGGQQGISSVNIRQYAINPALIEYIPAQFAYQFEVMPLDRLGTNLTVAMAMPLDHATRAQLEELTHLRVRAVLCSRSDVRATIEQYYGVSPLDMQTPGDDAGPSGARPSGQALPEDRQVRTGPEAVRLKYVLDILETVDAFPLLPRVHAHVMQMLDDPDVSVEGVGTVIEQDPTLAANVLRLANSAAYAARNRFDGVRRATAYIGLRELHSVVISSGVLQVLSEKTSMDLDALFRQAYRCGLLTKIIADAAKVGDRELAFTAGLLHDMGRIVLRYFSRERLIQIDDIVADTDRRRAEVEEEVIGITASEVAYHLMQRWNMPDTLEQAIRFHDRLDSIPDPPPVSLAIALALHCVRQDAAKQPFTDLDAEGVTASLLKRLGMKRATLDRVEDLYREALDNAPPFDGTMN